ncbi:hypothetical protein AArcMg_3232 [Natrarchaeobaculum sulfurireducens]|uniref:Uncharacterized protein n=1 Tax=Natrarchaeobaculum sulfurireducens TaxID=2044521 RepID=A0A346PIV2_9EURY|nr:hypothetical protein AArc1_3141 [Natrarchaeobaculum sulfurireducens]AXR83217.1 hypothetical protein AArcMg_3232 [Natrarchaeobaculum sulfurireducens]
MIGRQLSGQRLPSQGLEREVPAQRVRTSETIRVRERPAFDMDLGWYVAALGYPVIILGLIYLVYRSNVGRSKS